MSNFNRCPVCGEYDWLDKHKCAPVFEFLIPDYGDEWRRIHARSFEEAAEKACEMDDVNSAEYTIVSQGYLDEIQIRDQEGTVKRFSIRAEGVPTYYAKEITDDRRSSG